MVWVAEFESGRELRNKAVREILRHLEEAEVSGIEFEGPEIAVYVRNPKFILEGEEKVRELAKLLKKRVVVRTDPRVRKSRDVTLQHLLQLIPEDVNVDPRDVQFDEVLGEVRVLADKPGKLLGKGAALRSQVLAATGWRLEVYRKPPMASKVLDSIMRHMAISSERRRKALMEIGDRIYRDVVVGTRHVRIIGLGSFSEVGRSAILVDTGESKVLLDAGMSPSGTGLDAMPYYWTPEFRVEELDAIIVSHAHIDHIASLPLLYKYGYRGPVFVTPPTRDIMLLMLADFVELAKREGQEPIYTMKEIAQMMTRVITVNYDTVIDVAPDVKLTFVNAGHIMGSAMVHLHIGQGLYNILYSADFKYYRLKLDKGRRLLPPAVEEFHRVEALILEGTYGAKEPQPREKAEEDLVALVNKISESRGKLLLPVMAVGRGQDMMYVLYTLMKEKRIPEVPVYVDGMIYEVTAIYTEYPELLAKPVRDLIMYQGENPFVAENFVFVNDEDTRQEAINSQGPAVVISTSGMMTGGPVLEYFANFADDERNVLAFVSYQAPGTLARRLAEGEKEVEVPVDGSLKTLKVKMEVTSIEGFTGHATRSELLSFVKHLRPKPRTIILNHGEPAALLSLGRSIKESWQRMGFEAPPEILMPENAESIRLFPRSQKVKVALDYL
ncbi:MAG: beta-CASP ribonuclease aCPSF1 [Acidilobaceae archaeon]|nr:beta-CASP ribonuclease aCPSF1 [Acidilobaceae archaeon]